MTLGTSFSEIGDLFMSAITDNGLNTIFTSSGSLTFNTSIEPWLLKSIVEFSPVSNQILSYTCVSGSSDGYFSLDLTQENQIILAEIMQKFWLQKKLQDQRALENIVLDHDFKVHAPSPLVREKQNMYDTKREEISQLLQDYAYHNKSDWSSWWNQVFST